MKFQAFVEQYFTYSGDGGNQILIRNFSRHFSEAQGYTYREKHLAFLEKLILLLQERQMKFKK